MRIDVPNVLLLVLFVLACVAWLGLTLHRERACRLFASLHRLLFGKDRPLAGDMECHDPAAPTGKDC